MKYLLLSDISSYRKAFSLSNYVWDLVNRWSVFAKRTIGEQFVRAVDSISANIAEGFGRFGKNDKVRFYRISCGSVKESLDWNEKAKARRLLEDKEYLYILRELEDLPREINQLIKFTREKLKN